MFPEQQIDIQIPMQKYILIDNNLLIPLIALNATQIYNVVLTTAYKFINFVETSLKL